MLNDRKMSSDFQRKKSILKIYNMPSLAVQWLRLASTAGGADAIPGWRTKIPHAEQEKKKSIPGKKYQ